MAEVKIASSEDFAGVAARWIAEEVQSAIVARGSCALSLAGGSTPRAVYQSLAFTENIAWPQVDILFGDERAVPPDDATSNYRMVRESLLARILEEPLGVHRMEAERDDAAAAAAEYELLLPASLDVLVLGMGSDGHTASLFPDSPAVHSSRLIVPTVAPVPPARRLTITPLVIGTALRVVVLVTGAAKAAMVRQVLEGPYEPERFPAQFAREGTWFLDEGAASELSGR